MPAVVIIYSALSLLRGRMEERRLLKIQNIFLLLASLQAFAQQEYKASRFGIKSNGVIDNTTSIQKAVDWIAEQGGGTLVFNVGRYLTGAVQLRSGVNIRLNEGAVIVGSANIFTYKGCKGIFWGEGLENVVIFGRGVIDGQGAALKEDIADKRAKGYLPEDVCVPSLLYLKDCKGIVLRNFIFRSPATPTLYVAEGTEVTEDGCYTDTPL